MTTRCRVCAEPLDETRLRTGRLKRVCLDCLSPDERRALEHDLNFAAEVQARLLPARNFSFGRWQINYHYEPLGTVSGDHCDLIRPGRTGEDLHFLFGDVSGKGVAASILMANLQALFRSLVSLELPLAEIVARANRLFSESTAARSFATLVAGRLNGAGFLELCNAGHNPPLLARNAVVSQLDGGGFPLGVRPHSRFESLTVRLEPDDFLFLYTDGLSEASDGSGEEFGPRRVMATLDGLHGQAARTVVDSVLDSVRAFRNGAPREDDLTAMAIRWRGE